MKKFFFFKSSAPGSGNSNLVPLPLTDKQIYRENTSDNGSSPCLRRSLSSSSAAFQNGALGRTNMPCLRDQCESPCSSSSTVKRPDHRSSRCRTPTPERQTKSKCFEAVAVQSTRGVKKPGSVASSGTYHDSSEGSSYCSSNFSNIVLDRYIDGEQQQERGAPINISSQRNYIGNGDGKRPPRIQHTAPASPTDSVKGKPRSHSFREVKGTQLYFSSRDSVENGFGHDSPRRLAKHVIERLSQSRVLPRTSSKEFDPDVPITIEDIYDGSLNRCPSLNSDGVSKRICPLDGPDETTNKYQSKDIPGFEKENWFPGDTCEVLNSVDAEEHTELELLRKSKEAEERVLVLSEELEQENFLRDSGFNVPALIQTMRNLAEERVSMALDVSAILHGRIAERALAKEELRLVRSELDSRTRRLEKEKNELQSALEKELDRRSIDWSCKLEKYQAEENRLRERVRELAEQNVSLQREVSYFSEREMETKGRMTYSEQQLEDLTIRVEEVSEENQNLQQNVLKLQEKYKETEEDRECIQKNYEEKERECKDLHKSITRFLRTCSEQEKTIDGLREGLSEEVRKKSSMGKFDKQLGKLQMEQMRLTGVEQALRKEVESYRLQVDSLRHENITLLHRLKGIGKEGGLSTFKLDQELQNRVCCLQNQGLSLLSESNWLCSKLLDYIKEKEGQISETKQDIEVAKNGLDGQFVVEADIKIQGFKRGTESLRRGLQTIAAVLHEKSNLVALESHSHCLEDELSQVHNQNFKEIIRSELKAETLLTSLLREKLYSKEMYAEQLQAELAAAVRGNDVLRCEVQNALDSFSCVNHKMKDLELQLIEKDENINRLQNELQECTKESTIMRGILQKVSEERDLMWEEVKQYSEKNMLLNSEVSILKKKIEALDEDVLLKEGQITILKDTLDSSDSTREFLLQ